jgi:hypothetical protein
MLEPLGERVQLRPLEQRKYFISRGANWEALMGTKGNNQHQGDAADALVRPSSHFSLMRLILVCLHPKAGMASSTLEKPLRGWGEGTGFPGPPRALYTGYGSMPT